MEMVFLSISLLSDFNVVFVYSVVTYLRESLKTTFTQFFGDIAVVLRQRSQHVALSGLELFIDQASCKLTEILLPLLPHLAQISFLE